MCCERVRVGTLGQNLAIYNCCVTPSPTPPYLPPSQMYSACTCSSCLQIYKGSDRVHPSMLRDKPMASLQNILLGPIKIEHNPVSKTKVSCLCNTPQYFQHHRTADSIITGGPGPRERYQSVHLKEPCFLEGSCLWALS